MIKAILLLILVSTSLSCLSQETWEPPYVGSDPEVLYLPDAHAVYWRYGWKRKPGEKVGLKIEGQFPDARYFSYNVYNDDNKMSLGSFSDHKLIPDDGSTNTFTGNPESQGGSYTIYIVPEGTTAAGKNVLHFPDSLTNVCAFLRHYLAKGDINGGVPMPKLSLYNTETRTTDEAPKSVPIPKLTREEIENYLLPLFKDMAKKFEANPEAVIEALHHRKSQDSLKVNELVCRQVVSNAFTYFTEGEKIQSYNFHTEGTYPNKDNLYLVLPVIRNANEVLAVQFKAPRYPETPADYPTSELRYFSLSQGDEITHNFATTIDREMKVSEDGMIRFLIGDDSEALRTTAEKLGVNFQPWKVHQKMLLVYRHMLPSPDFKNGINHVPVVDKSAPHAGQEGAAFIGDYAPVGKLIPAADADTLESFPKF